MRSMIIVSTGVLFFMIMNTKTAEAGFPLRSTLPKEQDLVMICRVDDATMTKDCEPGLGDPRTAASPRTKAFLQIESATPDYLSGGTPGARVQVLVRRSTAAPLDGANPGRAVRSASSVSSPILDPDWEMTPIQQDLDGYFPERALRLSTSGEATVRCTVGPQGDLLGCWVQDENAPDMAFGLASLRISTFLKMKPMAKDGSPTAGRSYALHVVFNARSAKITLSSRG